MAYDEKLADRIARATKDWPGCAPKKMFGGVGWMLHGNMCVGVWKESLVVRCRPDDTPALLKQKHVGEFAVTGRPMKGWLLVAPAAIARPAALAKWLALSRDFVGTLPPK